MDATEDMAKRFRHACSQFATGVTVMMVRLPSGVHGMTANAFMSVSLSPLLVAVSVSHHSRMHQYLEPGRQFTISILQADQEWISNVFGRSYRHPEAKPQWVVVHDNHPIIQDAAAWFVCTLDQRLEAGDHTIVVGQVEDFGEEQAKAPLIFYRGKYFSQLGLQPDPFLEFSLLEQ